MLKVEVMFAMRIKTPGQGYGFTYKHIGKLNGVYQFCILGFPIILRFRDEAFGLGSNISETNSHASFVSFPLGLPPIRFKYAPIQSDATLGSMCVLS